MSLSAQPRRYTIEEYLRIERDSAQRHEYFDGEIVAMAGRSPQHSLVIANIVGEVRQRLKGTPCRMYEANLRVRIPRSRHCVYPDATIVCGPIESDPDDRSGDTIVNPRAVIQVLSPPPNISTTAENSASTSSSRRFRNT